MDIRTRFGQSLMELLVGIAVGAIFIVGAASIIVPSLKINMQAGNVQAQAQLGQEMLNNVQAWADGNWSGVLSLATGTATEYHLDTVTSPFTVGNFATPAFVQNASNTIEENGSSYTSISAQFTGNVTTGNTIVVAVAFSSGSDITGCRDTNNATSTYKEAIAYATNSAKGLYLDIWYATNVTGGTTPTVTCAFGSSASYNDIAIQEYSGIASTNPVDATSTSNTGSGASTAWTTGSGVTTQSNELIFGAFQGNSGSQIISPGTGFSTRTQNGVQGNFMTEDEVQSSAGSIAATASTAVSDNQVNAMVTFKPATSNIAPESIQICSGTLSSSCVNYQRYFYLSDVYRDANGNVTSTASGNFYDPSTKLVTVVINQVSSTAAPATYSLYITRSGNNALSQSTWSGGSGQTGPVTTLGNTYATATSITVSASGTLQLSKGSSVGSCTL